MKFTLTLLAAATLAVAAPSSGAPASEVLTKRGCWDIPGHDYACVNQYCKSRCGNNGEWCWMARDHGNGPWLECQENGHCQTANIPHDAACGHGDNCSACGCSC